MNVIQVAQDMDCTASKHPQNYNASLVFNGSTDFPIAKVTCKLSSEQVTFYVEHIKQHSYNPSFERRLNRDDQISEIEAMDYPRFEEEGSFDLDRQISEIEAMDYPRFGEDGKIIDDLNEATKIKTENNMDWGFDYLDDEYQLLNYQFDEDAQIVHDTFDDAFDYARSNENGWYYSDKA